MYPDEIFVYRGIFVKNIERILIENGYFVRRIVLKNTYSIFWKAIYYAAFYLNILVSRIKREYDFIYLHYGAHNSIPVILIKVIFPSQKIVYHVHGSDIIPSTVLLRLLLPMTKMLLRKVDSIIVPSYYFKGMLNTDFTIPLEKIVVYPSGGIDSRYFFQLHNKSNARADVGLDPTSNYIGYVGNIKEEKGCWVLLKAFYNILLENKDINIKLIIIGDGSEKESIEKSARDLVLQDVIIFVNQQSQDKLRLYYNSFDVLCFPTMYTESLGLVGIEAMTCGTPVIGSRIGGLTDYIIDGENGFFVEPNNVESLQEKILLYFSLPLPVRNNMIQSALATAQRYDSSKVQKTLFDVFNNS